MLDQVRQMIIDGKIEQFIGVFIDAEGVFGTVYCRDSTDYRMVGAIEVAKLEMLDELMQGVTTDHA